MSPTLCTSASLSAHVWLCIGFLLLHSNFINLAAYISTYLLLPSFCGSGLGHDLVVSSSSGSHKAAIETLTGAVILSEDRSFAFFPLIILYLPSHWCCFRTGRRYRRGWTLQGISEGEGISVFCEELKWAKNDNGSHFLQLPSHPLHCLFTACTFGQSPDGWLGLSLIVSFTWFLVSRVDVCVCVCETIGLIGVYLWCDSEFVLCIS